VLIGHVFYINYSNRLNDHFSFVKLNQAMINKIFM